MKVLKILLLSIIFTTTAIGQSMQMLDSLKSGKPIPKYVSKENPLPVIGPLVKSTVVYIDTVVKRASVRTDTILISGTKWSKLKFKGMASTDSLELAYGITAPTTFQRIFGTTPIIIEYLDKTYFTKVFIRAYGIVSAIRTYELIIESY